MKTEITKTAAEGAITRRTFMSRAVAVAAAFVGASHTDAAATGPASVKISPYSYLALSRQLGTSFTLRTPRGRHKLVLTQVTEDRCDALLQQYTARFVIKGNPATKLFQEVYDVHHRKLGNLSLLLSPGNSGKTQTLLATFSHLKS